MVYNDGKSFLEYHCFLAVRLCEWRILLYDIKEESCAYISSRIAVRMNGMRNVCVCVRIVCVYLFVYCQCVLLFVQPFSGIAASDLVDVTASYGLLYTHALCIYIIYISSKRIAIVDRGETRSRTQSSYTRGYVCCILGEPQFQYYNILCIYVLI